MGILNRILNYLGVEMDDENAYLGALVVQHELRERAPRRFVLRRNQDETGVSGTGIVAHGVQFEDGTCVTRWMVTDVRQTCVWRGIADVLAIHGHAGSTELVWLDI